MLRLGVICVRCSANMKLLFVVGSIQQSFHSEILCMNCLSISPMISTPLRALM